MKIVEIAVFARELPLKKPYWLSGGRLRFDALDSTYLRMTTDEGLVGWGEACPWGATYLAAHGRGARAAIAEIAPGLIGRDPRALDALNRAMDVALPGHGYGKAAIDIAAWDILGQSADMALVDLLGGREGGPVPIASSVSTGTPAEMVAEIARFRDLGYRVHSAKVGGDVETDIARIRAMKAAELPGETIFYDVNRAWRPREAMGVMNATRDLDIWFEQPCESFEECLQVRRATVQPISLDEIVTDYGLARRIAETGACEIVNIKLNRVGGLTKARRIRDLCLEAGLQLLIMDTGGGVVSDTAVAHFAQSVPETDRLGTWSCQEMVSFDPAPGRGARNVDGCFTAPDAPGLGVAPQEGVLGEPVAVYR